MTTHVISPHDWETQVADILPNLADGDEVWLHDQFTVQATKDAMTRWGFEADVRFYHQPVNGNCKRCGGEVRGPFCGSCKQGKIHGQDCPKLWDNSEDPTMIAMAQEGPCNCGGDAIHNTGGDGTD